MVFLITDVENACQSLSQLFKRHIKTKIINPAANATLYGSNEALLFFVADWLSKLKLLKPEQVSLLIDEFTEDILKFGIEFDIALSTNKKLPVCKIGFMDRKLACMDGRDRFLDLETGENKPVAEIKALETIAYNLTALFFRYKVLTEKVSKAEVKTSEQ